MNFASLFGWRAGAVALGSLGLGTIAVFGCYVAGLIPEDLLFAKITYAKEQTVYYVVAGGGWLFAWATRNIVPIAGVWYRNRQEWNAAMRSLIEQQLAKKA